MKHILVVLIFLLFSDAWAMKCSPLPPEILPKEVPSENQFFLLTLGTLGGRDLINSYRFILNKVSLSYSLEVKDFVNINQKSSMVLLKLKEKKMHIGTYDLSIKDKEGRNLKTDLNQESFARIKVTDKKVENPMKLSIDSIEPAFSNVFSAENKYVVLNTNTQDLLVKVNIQNSKKEYKYIYSYIDTNQRLKIGKEACWSNFEFTFNDVYSLSLETIEAIKKTKLKSNSQSIDTAKLTKQGNEEINKAFNGQKK